MKTSISGALALTLAASVAHAQDLPQAGSDWFTAGQEALQERLATTPNTNRARNVIILVADGNGVGTNYATRLFMGQQEGGFGDEFVQHFEAFPHLALVKTYNVNAQTPDSAGTSTSMLSGVKTKAGIIGVTENVTRGDCATLPGNEVTSIAEIMTEAGKSTGIISTARITHATPAAAYAKTVDRNFEASVPEGCETQTDIATQLVDAMEAGVIDVAMGGGRRNFIGEDITVEEETTGRRAAGENLIQRAQEIGARYVWDSASFGELDTAADGPVLGLFESSHMQYEADREGEPSLAEMTAAAIEVLSANEEGFFLQVESGRVDHANHAGNLARVVRDGAAFTEAVAIADELTDDEDTLIIVTADHEHAIAFNGYCGRGSNILGLCMGIDGAGIEHTGEPELADDGKPFSVVGYLNGPGSVLIQQPDGNYYGGRAVLDEEMATDIDFLQQALVPKSSETHSGEDVAAYAKGPWAHLVNGTMEQNVLFHIMNHAATAE